MWHILHVQHSGARRYSFVAYFLALHTFISPFVFSFKLWNYNNGFFGGSFAFGAGKAACWRAIRRGMSNDFVAPGWIKVGIRRSRQCRCTFSSRWRKVRCSETFALHEMLRLMQFIIYFRVFIFISFLFCIIFLPFVSEVFAYSWLACRLALHGAHLKGNFNFKLELWQYLLFSYVACHMFSALPLMVF